MFEKVNPGHPDKVADRIAGACVDLAYNLERNPKIAVEVLVGHGVCHVIIETTAKIKEDDVKAAIERIAGPVIPDISIVPQDRHLAENQNEAIRCGDNGIFRGVPMTEEQKTLSRIAKDIYEKFPYDGKYILNGNRLIICQSNAKTEDLEEAYPGAEVNPLEIGPAVQMWTLVQPIVSWAVIWVILLQVVAFMEKTFPRLMFLSISVHS